MEDPIGIHPRDEEALMEMPGIRRGIPYGQKILILGDTGFLGHHLVPVLEDAFPRSDLICIQGQKFFNLVSQHDVSLLFKKTDPDIVINMAALSGGIEDNRNFQADYFYQNLMINVNIFEACKLWRHSVKKLIAFVGGCAYPNTAESPIKEEVMWDGVPVWTSVGYSMAKKMSLIAAFAYKDQWNLDTTILIPGNMYGPFDNFHPKKSHVIPGLIRRIIEAKHENYDTVTIWGSGRPVRDFVYVKDVAQIIPHFIDNYKDIGPINISTGKGTTIKELAETISELTEYSGKLYFDRSKPDGQMLKTFDNTKLMDFATKLNIEIEFTDLKEGLKETIDWYEDRILGLIKKV
jgi:GDP-L-fucose synthase